MPYAVTHILSALIAADFIRDHIVKDRKKFPLYYVLVAGIAGLVQDIDIVVFWGLQFFGFSLKEVHRMFTHTIFLPLSLLVLAFILWRSKRVRLFLLMVFLGTSLHLLLDFALAGFIRPFYPFSNTVVGLNLIKEAWSETLMPGIDAILLVLWLVHEEKKHKISDFF